MRRHGGLAVMIVSNPIFKICKCGKVLHASRGARGSDNRRMPMVRTSAAAMAIVALTSVGARAADDHVMVSPDQLKWGAGPPSLPKGGQLAVLSGDPSK